MFLFIFSDKCENENVEDRCVMEVYPCTEQVFTTGTQLSNYAVKGVSTPPPPG